MARMKKSWLTLLLASWAMLVAAVQPQNNEALYRQALGLARIGNFFEAQDLFKQVLKKDPFYIACRRGVDLLRDLNNGAAFPAAVQVIVSGMEADSKFDWKEAVEEYRKALEMAPGYYFVLHNLGTSTYESGQTDKAIALFEKALKQKEDYPYTHNNLGLALNRMGRFKEALAHYQRAIALFPQYHKAYNNMGANYMAMGLEKEGNAMYQKALEVNSNYTLAYQNVLPPEKKVDEEGGDEFTDEAVAAAGQLVPTQQLLETLENGPPLDKKKAQEELILRKDQAAVRSLIRLLDSPSSLIRAAAVETLGNMQSREALVPLTNLVKDPEWTVRCSAVEALGQINEPSSLPVLLSALQDPDFHTRYEAIWAAAMSKSPLALEPLLQMLNDPIAEVREACVNCLPYMVEVIPRDITIGFLRHERGLERSLGVRLIDAGKIRMETTEETASLYVAQKQWKKLEAMSVDGATALRAALDFQDFETRVQAVNALSRMGGQDALSHLYYALKDKEPKVREAACNGLRQVTGQDLKTVEQWLAYFQKMPEAK
jgi:HEAT repeat protein/TolA-binding protein